MIRKARESDAEAIARLIILAMDDLAAKFTAQSDPFEVIRLFEKFAGSKSNQYSYDNVLVYEEEEKVFGMISAYDGANLELLRAPFLEFISAEYGVTKTPENETQEGEYYIDCVSVNPDKQGKGIGKQLIIALIEHATTIGHQTIGLLVSKNNPSAEKLYRSLGFHIANEKEFMGGSYFHMQYCKTTRSGSTDAER